MSNDEDALRRDFETWLKKFEALSPKSPDAETNAALRALMHLTQLLSAQRSPEEYKQAMELIYSGRCELRFTVYIRDPITIEGDLVTPDGQLKCRLIEVRGEPLPAVRH